MSITFSSILKILGGVLSKFLGEILSLTKEVFKFLNNKHEDKEKEEKKQFEKKVDEVIDNGTIEDLINLRK